MPATKRPCRWRRASRTRIASLLGLTSAVVLSGVAVIHLGRVDAHAEQRSTSTPVSIDGADDQLVLADQSSWVTPNGTFSISVELPAEAPTGKPTLTLRVGDRIHNRSDFAAQVALGVDPDRAVRGSAALNASQLTLDNNILTGELPVSPLGLTEVGVYPLTVSIAWPQRSASLLTFVTVANPTTTFPALSVAVVVPIHVPTTTTGVKSDDVRRLIELGTALNSATPTVPFALAPTPDTLQRLENADSTDARTALSLLRDAAQDHPTLLRPYVPADPGALGRAGLVDVLTEAWTLGREVVENLLAVEPQTDTWLAEANEAGGELDAAGVAVVRGLKLNDNIRFLVSSELLSDPTDQFSAAQPVELGDVGDPNAEDPQSVPALLADETLASRFQLNDSVLAANLVAAELAVLWEETPSRTRSLALVPSRHTVVSARGFTALQKALANHPWIQTVDLPTAIGATAPVTGGLDGFRDRRGEAGLTLVESATKDVEAARSTLTRGGTARGQLDSAYFATISADITGAQQRLQATQGLQRDVASLTSDVLELPGPRTIRLTARDGELPLTVRNSSDHPIQVRVGVASTKVTIRGGDPLRFVLEPGTTTLTIPIRSRGSGSFSLPVRLLSPVGGLELGATRFTVHPTGTAGGGVLAYLGLAALIAAWWIRWARKHGALGGTGAPGPAPAGPGASGPGASGPGDTTDTEFTESRGFYGVSGSAEHRRVGSA